MKKVLAILLMLLMLLSTLAACDFGESISPTTQGGGTTTQGGGTTDPNGGTTSPDGGSTGSTDSGTPAVPPLAASNKPTNLRYDATTGVLTWDAVPGAISYVARYNGTEVPVTEGCSVTMPFLLAENNFSVKAISSENSASDWSDTYTHTCELSVYQKVTLALSEYVKSRGYELVEVVGLFESLDGKKQLILQFELLVKRNEVVQNYYLETVGGEYEVSKILENIQKIGYGNFLNEGHTVDYNSAQYLLDSGKYDGEMQRLYDQGYEISVVSSCVREGSGSSTFTYRIVGTYKAEKNGDVKYFSSVNKVSVQNKSRDDSTNYEKSLLRPGHCTVTEESFTLHEEGKTLLYMEDLIKAKEENKPCIIDERFPMYRGTETTIVIPAESNGKKIDFGDFFKGKQNITHIAVPNGISELAFEGCTGLTSVTICNGVTFIGESAFKDCDSLMSVTICNGVTFISESAFKDCNSLMSVSIPSSVTSIGAKAFYGCTGLTSITIPDSVTEIGWHAFYGCTGLTSITIPNSVTSIGSHAFYGCTGLTRVTFVNTEGWYLSSIGTSDTAIDVTNPATNARNLRYNYDEYDWKRKAA